MGALLADLFPWLVAFYVLDGLVQPRRGHLLLVSGPGGFRARGAGLHLLGLSPLEEVVAAFDLPFLAAGARVFLLDPGRRAEPAVIEAADLAPHELAALAPLAREGRKVLAAGRGVALAPAAEWAEAVRVGLAALARGAPPDAPARLDLDAARALRARARPFVLVLRALGALLSLALFVLWPLVAQGPLAASIPAGALLGAVVALVVLVAATAAAMQLACGAGVARSLSAGAALLAPWAAAHPLLHASRGLYARFDALTVAAALLPPERFRALAARELARARFSRARTPPELAPAWDARTGALEGLLAATGSSAAEALAPPRRLPDTAGFCPLCRAQYRAGFERCGDCGVPVEGFGSAA
jgi:hypothetical protein